MYDVKQIKARINCVDLANKLGLPIRHDGDRCVSPLRSGAKNSHSFAVHEAFWQDYGSGMHGDVIDLQALMCEDGDRGKAIYHLAQMVGVPSDENTQIWRDKTQAMCSEIQTWHENLTPEAYNYLHSRKIKNSTIDKLRIGYRMDRVIIPYYKNGYPVSWIGRSLNGVEPKYFKMKFDEDAERVPWGLDTLNRTTPSGEQKRSVYIAEGTFDALSLWQEGYCVLASMGGHFSKEVQEQVLAICKDFKEVILAFDNDDAGKGFTWDLAQDLVKNHIYFSVLDIPKPCKDISDYYMQNGTIASIPKIEGLDYLAQNITDKELLRKVGRTLSTTLDSAEMLSFWSKVDKYRHFDSVWLKETQNMIRKAPSEPYIVEEICNNHRLIYLQNVGFYEYSDIGRWERKPITQIESYIAKELGVFASGNKINSIKGLLKPEVLYTGELDKKPLMNFTNGTLDLTTGEFRDFSSNDMMSIQLPYAYLPDAECPIWEKFIEQVTDGDRVKQENLQFLTGYILFENCPHEKIFVLTGNGGNGKSRFTMILEKLFGKENVTNLTPQGLIQDFERVHLRSSMVNIAGEIKSNFKGAEEVMKQVASGETIRACYKGQDFISFQPRCKLIFACNGQPSSTDTSEGLFRRLKIINFPCRFVANPNPRNPLEKPIDTNLSAKLETELSGIFNWAYEGYRTLKRIGYFTENEEELALKKQFMERSNPVKSFFRDWLQEGYETRNRQDLYVDYNNWCTKNGHLPCGNDKFYALFSVESQGIYEEIIVGVGKGSYRAYRLCDGVSDEERYNWGLTMQKQAEQKSLFDSDNSQVITDSISDDEGSNIWA